MKDYHHQTNTYWPAPSASIRNNTSVIHCDGEIAVADRHLPMNAPFCHLEESYSAPPSQKQEVTASILSPRGAERCEGLPLTEPTLPGLHPLHPSAIMSLNSSSAQTSVPHCQTWAATGSILSPHGAERCKGLPPPRLPLTGPHPCHPSAIIAPNSSSANIPVPEQASSDQQNALLNLLGFNAPTVSSQQPTFPILRNKARVS